MEATALLETTYFYLLGMTDTHGCTVAPAATTAAQQPAADSGNNGKADGGKSLLLRCCEVTAVGFLRFAFVGREDFQNKKARTHRFSLIKKVSVSLSSGDFF